MFEFPDMSCSSQWITSAALSAQITLVNKSSKRELTPGQTKQLGSGPQCTSTAPFRTDLGGHPHRGAGGHHGAPANPYPEVHLPDPDSRAQELMDVNKGKDTWVTLFPPWRPSWAIRLVAGAVSTTWWWTRGNPCHGPWSLPGVHQVRPLVYWPKHRTSHLMDRISNKPRCWILQMRNLSSYISGPP